MDKIRTIVGKEWAEVFKNRLVLFSVAFLPLIFIALPIVTFAFAGGAEGTEASLSGETVPGMESLCAGMGESDCGQLYLLNLYAFMFMILPVAIPVTIAAYSIVGEKTTRSLEPLLATPITTVELLVAKALAAMIPAVVVTWIGFGVFVVTMAYLVTPLAFRYLLDPMWFIAIFVGGPLLTLLAVSTAIIVSSRVSDPRVAEQLSMVVLIPVILGIVGQSVGLFLIDQTFILILIAVVAVVDVVLLYLAVNLFQRERILTEWK